MKTSKTLVHVTICLAVVAVVVLAADPAHASSSGLSILEKIKSFADEVTGGGARYVGMIGTVVFGFVAWFAPDGALKKWMAALCCLCVIFGATQIVDFFGASSGLALK